MVSANFLSQALFAGAALASGLHLRRDQCTSDDACEGACRAVDVKCEGANVTPTEAVIAEARRRYQDYHCVNSQCQCAVTSDDQAQDFCQYLVENDKAFKGFKYDDGHFDFDTNTITCVIVPA
ncbi:uncharacterized protein RCC_00516 [Ramularia collo-cygni]|uniref:Uncharacterized protein n=1 Tax=Ramularia collo-cygni TaxID=112498 RepID=A0A2D3UZA6_9PEZI|nr:uncharacterized protein RCC_00516 [Ramularia collo-cygni]CZT14539.1 uncharacterized protein RCC_00516 [Ramularia collo-cygni]